MQLETGAQLRLIVNGEATETDARTLADLIARLGFGETAVATALNGDFVPRGKRAQTRLAMNDAIEIVAPRQGG